jgi:hypothetical protein
MNQAYNQFSAVPRRYQEDSSRAEGIAGGIVLGASIATAGIGAGKITQKIANHGYNKRIKHLENGRLDRMEKAANPHMERATALQETADLVDNTATSRARREGRRASGGVAPSNTSSRTVRNVARMNPRQSAGRTELNRVIGERSASGREAATNSINQSRSRAANLRTMATEQVGLGEQAAERSNSRTNRAISKITGMRDSMKINRVMNTVSGSWKKNAITIGVGAAVSGILGGMLDSPNS